MPERSCGSVCVSWELSNDRLRVSQYAESITLCARKWVTGIQQRDEIEFTVVRSLSPACWKWTVVLGHTEKAGKEPVREPEILRAKKFIDKLIKSRQQAAE